MKRFSRYIATADRQPYPGASVARGPIAFGTATGGFYFPRIHRPHDYGSPSNATDISHGEPNGAGVFI